MKSLILIALATFAVQAHAGSVGDQAEIQCENADYQVNVQANTDPGTVALYSHIVMLFQKAGGVPLAVPTNKSLDANNITHFANSDVDFDLGVTSHGVNSTLKAENENDTIDCK